jgi:stage III sporulation protein AD
MEIMQIVGLGLIAAILSTLLRKQIPEMAIFIGIVTSILIFLFVSNGFINIIKLLNTMSNRADIDDTYITTIIKVIGIAYVTQFGAEICRDSGESAIASKIEMGGKILIVIFAAPILISLLELLIKLLP